MAPTSSRRFFVWLRKTSPIDRVALAILLLSVLISCACRAGNELFHYSGLLGFLSFLAIIYLVIRLIPWFRTQVMWPLRNRLIVAYVFIAVVPVILLFSMAGVGLLRLVSAARRASSSRRFAGAHQYGCGGCGCLRRGYRAGSGKRRFDSG